MKYIMLTLVLTTLLNANFVFAHGENKIGPNGGFIRMPGDYHTELVLDGKNKLKVYLLNMQWKNPSVTKAKLEISHQGKTATKAKCTVVENYFSCVFPEAVDLSLKGNLKVTSEREGQSGMEVFYPLPFKLEAPSANHEGHGNSH